MSRLPFIKEKSYVCDPQNFIIKMKFDNRNSIISATFFDGETECFNLRYQMNMTSDEEDINNMLTFVLESLIDQLTKKEFQSFILDDELLGMNFYNLIKSVRAKSGKVIWVRQ